MNQEALVPLQPTQLGSRAPPQKLALPFTIIITFFLWHLSHL